jgi:glycosyltransferase involved in cell wall biosynthesis
MSDNSIVITVYSHPEFYPPTLNLIDELSLKFDKVYVLSRNVFDSKWIYTNNTELISTGKRISIRDSEKANNFEKIVSFFSYTFSLWKLCLINKPKYVILCDPIPTLSFYLISPFLSKSIKIWYHNHDVLEFQKVKKFSISWFSHFSEKALFIKLAIFTLPSEERIKYFPLKNLLGKYYFLPNYPRVKYYSKFKKAIKSECEIRLLFQGSIGLGHGLEEIINLLHIKVNNKKLVLVLKGFCSYSYKSELFSIAIKNNVTHQVEFQDYSAYIEMPKMMSACQIGIAIYRGVDVMNSTLGTASNKIYEYAAMGLPVLLFDNKYFNEHLSSYKFCAFTNLNQTDILEKIKYLDDNYDYFSSNALGKFNSELNFENFFKKIEL